MDHIRQKLQKFLNQFPDDATEWKFATDEVRDIARTAKEYYNDMENANMPACNFRSMKSPSEWNTLGKEYIFKVYDKMSSNTKADFQSYLARTFNIK